VGVVVMFGILNLFFKMLLALHVVIKPEENKLQGMFG